MHFLANDCLPFCALAPLLQRLSSSTRSGIHLLLRPASTHDFSSTSPRANVRPTLSKPALGPLLSSDKERLRTALIQLYFLSSLLAPSFSNSSTTP